MPAFDPSCIEVEDFLECLEIRNVRRATEKEFCFSCPYPAHTTGDEKPSAYMNAHTTAFLCHSCHAKGNAVSFTADILGVSPLEAIRMLKQRYSPGGIDPSARDMVAEIRKIIASRIPIEQRKHRILDPAVLDRYSVDWWSLWERCQRDGGDVKWATYMFSRGFSPDTLTDWHFGYSTSKDRITLPIHDEHGNLIGIKARAWNDRRPKYLNLRDQENDIEPYLKNDVVFALNRARPYRHLNVVEGEFNAIAMHAFDWVNTVAINGSYFGAKQIKLLRQYADSATLFFDSDSAGRDATTAVAEELHPFMPVYICPDHWGDPAEMNERSMYHCLKDRISYAQWRLAAVRQLC